MAVDDFSLLDIAAPDDLSTIAYGGTSANMTVMKEHNNSYEIVYEEVIGSFVTDTATDALFQYYIAGSPLGLHIFYECPPECSSCFFPNNCSTCISGYQLEGGKCIREYSHCVQN